MSANDHNMSQGAGVSPDALSRAIAAALVAPDGVLRRFVVDRVQEAVNGMLASDGPIAKGILDAVTQSANDRTAANAPPDWKQASLEAFPFRKHLCTMTSANFTSAWSKLLVDTDSAEALNSQMEVEGANTTF